MLDALGPSRRWSTSPSLRATDWSPSRSNPTFEDPFGPRHVIGCDEEIAVGVPTPFVVLVEPPRDSRALEQDRSDAHLPQGANHLSSHAIKSQRADRGLHLRRDTRCRIRHEA